MVLQVVTIGVEQGRFFEPLGAEVKLILIVLELIMMMLFFRI